MRTNVRLILFMMFLRGREYSRGYRISIIVMGIQNIFLHINPIPFHIYTFLFRLEIKLNITEVGLNF